MLDMHTFPSLRKNSNHNSSPWFESIRGDLFKGKRERRQADRKWGNTDLSIFKDLYRQAKHKVSKLVHTAKCKFYTERIALASSSKEMHQIVNTFSHIQPTNILPNIYSDADLNSLFIRRFITKVEKFEDNIASQPVASKSALFFLTNSKTFFLRLKTCHYVHYIHLL